jgi:hypothetical protein
VAVWIANRVCVFVRIIMAKKKHESLTVVFVYIFTYRLHHRPIHLYLFTSLHTDYTIDLFILYSLNTPRTHNEL